MIKLCNMYRYVRFHYSFFVAIYWKFLILKTDSPSLVVIAFSLKCGIKMYASDVLVKILSYSHHFTGE